MVEKYKKIGLENAWKIFSKNYENTEQKNEKI